MVTLRRIKRVLIALTRVLTRVPIALDINIFGCSHIQSILFSQPDSLTHNTTHTHAYIRTYKKKPGYHKFKGSWGENFKGITGVVILHTHSHKHMNLAKNGTDCKKWKWRSSCPVVLGLLVLSLILSPYWYFGNIYI